MRKPNRPTPDPETPIARRLEQVRTREGFPSLRSFWQQLAEGWADDQGRVSYEAARNYHFDRDPPVAYLVRVSEVFGVSVEWLATGQGQYERRDDYVAEAFGARTDDEVTRATRLHAAFDEGAGAEWENHGEEGRQILRPVLPLYAGGTSLPLLVGLWKMRRRAYGGDDLGGEEELRLAWEIGKAIVAPLEALGIDGRSRFLLIEHIEAMAPVLRRLIEHERTQERRDF